MEKTFKKIIAIVLIVAMNLTNVGMATFAVSIQNYANKSRGEEQKEDDLRYRYYEGYKYEKTTLLMNNDETSLDDESVELNEDVESNEDVGANEDVESNESVGANSVSPEEAEEDFVNPEEEFADENESVGASDSVGGSYASPEEESVDDNESVGASYASPEEETVAEDATEVSDEEKETEVETSEEESVGASYASPEEESIDDNESVGASYASPEEETTAEELSDVVATDSEAEVELDLFGADVHYHKACGASNNQTCNHPGIGNHTTLITYAIFDNDVVTGGNYYLTENKTISDELTLDRDMFICLNGFNLTIPKFNLSEYKITITDCQENVGSISSTSDNVLFYGGNVDVIYTKNENEKLLVKADTVFDSSASDAITTSINAYGVKFSPVSTSAKSLVGVRGSNINLYKTTFTGFNIKDENLITIRKATYVKDCTFTGNTVTNAIFRLNDDVTLTFEGDNLVTDNTSGYFIRSIGENSTIGTVTLNDNVDIIDNKFCQMLAIRYGDTLNINGNLNVKGNTSVTTISGVSVSGTPVTIVAYNSATVNINKDAKVFIGKNDSGTKAKLTSVMIANGTDTAEDAKKASINVYGTLDIDGVEASENICYILNGGTFNMENNISLSNISYGYHGFSSSATAGGFNFKSGVLDITNLTRTGSVGASALFYISYKAYIDADINIKSSSVHNVFRLNENSEVIINGDVNIGGEGVGNTIGNDVMFLYGAPSAITINGNFNVESNTITRYLALLYDRGYEGSPAASTNTEEKFSAITLSEKSTFTFKNNVAKLNNVTSVRGNISLSGNYNRFISKGAFNVIGNQLGHTIDQPFITISINKTMFDGAFAEFSGVTTFEENISDSFFAFGGSEGTATDWNVLRISNKFIIKNNKLHQNFPANSTSNSGFVNISQKVEWKADTIVEGNEMFRLFWFRGEAANAIESPVTLTNNKFYREFVKTEGDLTINANINATGNTFGHGFIVAKSSLIVNANINLADSTVKNLNVGNDTGITEAGSLIYVYNDFTINNGKQLNITGSKIYRVADRSQSVIRLDSKNCNFNMSSSGSLTIYDTTLVCETASADITAKTNVAGIYANAGLLMKLGNGIFKIASLSETGAYANDAMENHLFGIYAENVEGFISQISGTKFNASNRIEKVAFNTADQQGVVFIGWGTAATNPATFENNWSADTTYAPEGVDFVLEYRESDGNLWVSDGSEVHAHKICGIAENEKCSTHGEGFDTVNHETITYGKLSNATITKFLNGTNYEMSGRYYLVEDLNITEEQQIVLTEDLYICLNGYSIGKVKFTSSNNGQIFVTNCKNEEATIVGRTSNTTLFENCYPTVLAGKGTINLNANSIWFINTTFERKDVNLYNVKCEPNKTESIGRHTFFVEGGAGVPTITVSSVSFANYTIAGSAVRIYQEANAYFYDCSWKNISNSGAHAMFTTNKDGNVTFKNCTFENLTSTNTGNDNVDIFTINNANTKISTYSLINCSVKGISITGDKENNVFNAASTGHFIIENTTIENAQGAYSIFRMQKTGQIVLNNATIEGCECRNDFLKIVADGAVLNTKGVVTFNNNTVTNNSFYACVGVSPQWINEGTLNITNNNIAQNFFYLGGASGSGKFYSEAASSVLNITGNTITRQNSSQKIWYIESEGQGLHLGGVVNVNDNILNSTSDGGHFVLSIIKAGDLKFTGKININGNKSSYRLVNIGANVDFDCEELNLIGNTLYRKLGKSQYLIAMDNSGTQINLNNTNLTIKDNVLDCTDNKAASTDTNWVAAIGINAADSKGILVGNGNIIIKDNTETNSDGIWQNKFYGVVAYEIGGAFKQIEGTTIGAGSKVENVGFKSTDGCGIILSGTTKDVSSQFTLNTTKFPGAGLQVLYQDGNLYAVDSNGLHAHKDCGAGVNEVCSHDGIAAHDGAVVYSRFAQGDTFPAYGYIYLSEDITMNIGSTTNTITKDLHICLNGHTLNVTRSSDIAVFTLGGYSLYITNCKDVEGNFVTDSRKKEFATAGALKAMSSKGTINIKTDYLLYATDVTKDSVELYNVALSMVKTGESLSWNNAGVINTKNSKNDVIISSVSITGYKLDYGNSSPQATRFLNHDQTANKVNIYLYDVKINNCYSGSKQDFIVVGTNNGDFVVKDLTVDTCDFGQHSLIAVRANTKLQLEGVNTVKNISTTFNADNSALCLYLDAATTTIEINGDFILENIEYNTTSAYVASVRTGTLIINGNLYLKNPSWATQKQASLVNMSTGKVILNEGGSIRFEGEVDEEGKPISKIKCESADAGLIRHTGSSGGFTLNGDIYIKNVDMSGLSYLFYTSTQPIMEGGKVYVENVKIGKGILDIHAGCEINKEIKIDNCEVGENILYVDGDVIFKDTIEMTNNKTGNNIALINGNVDFAANKNVIIENNEMTRKAEVTQGIFNIVKTGVTINSLGSMTIRNNTLINDIVATERTFAAAIRIPNESKFIIGKDPIIVKDNITTGENADAALEEENNFPEYNHLFGIMSDNINGFMETTGTFNANSYLENVIFTSEDGFGQIFANWTGAAPSYITADKTIIEDVKVDVQQGALWIKDSSPLHYHTTCGIFSDENTTCSKVHGDMNVTHQYVLYSILRSGKKLPTYGNVYLSGDYEIEDAEFQLTGDLYICLNGHNLKATRFNLKNSDVNYNIYISNCSHNAVTIDTPAATKNNDFVFNHGGIQIMSVKGTITLKADIILNTDTDTGCDLMLYNVIVSQKTEGAVSYTGTRIDYKPKNHNAYVSSVSFVDYNPSGNTTFYYSNNNINGYFRNVRFDNLDVYNFFRYAGTGTFDFDNCTFSNITLRNKNLLSQDSYAGTLVVTNTTFDKIKTTSAADQNARIIFVEKDNAKVILDNLNFNDIDFTLNSNANPATKILGYTASQLSTISNITATNVKVAVFAGMTTSSVEINGDLLIKDSTFTGNVFDLNRATITGNANITVEDTTVGTGNVFSNASGTNGNVNIGGDVKIKNVSITQGNFLNLVGSGRAFNILGNFDIESSTIESGDGIKTNEDTVDLSIGKNFTIKGNTFTSGSVINLAKGNSFSVGGNLVSDGNVIVAEKAMMISRIATTIGGNLEAKNIVTGKNIMDVNNVTIEKELIFDNVQTGGASLAVQSNGLVTINGKFTVQNSLTTESIVWMGSNGVLDINGESYFYNNTINNYIMKPQADFVIKKNMTIASNSFLGVGFTASGNIDIRDGAKLSITKNTIYRHGKVESAEDVPTEDDIPSIKVAEALKEAYVSDMVGSAGNDRTAFIRLSGAGKNIELNNTGSFEMTENNIIAYWKKAEYDLPEDSYFALVGLLTDTSAINVGNGVFKIADNTFDYGSNTAGRRETTLFNVYSTNVNGVINQNEGTKFNTSSNYVGIVGFDAGGNMSEGVIYPDWNSDNVTNYTEDAHLKIFDNTILDTEEKYFGLSLIDNSVVLKQATHEDHYICGVDSEEDHAHGDNDLFKHKASDSVVIDYKPLLNKEDIKNGGDYFLISDLVFSELTTVKPSKKLRLCLNGFSVKNVLFRFDATDYAVDDETDKSVIICNCSDVTSIIENSSANDLFDNMILFGRRVDDENNNVQIRSNKVANGKVITALNTSFTQYDDTAADYVFNFVDADDSIKENGKGIQNSIVSEYNNKASIFKGGNVEVYGVDIVANENSSYIFNNGDVTLKAIQIHENTGIKESFIKATNLYVMAENEETTSVLISENEVVRQKKQQTLVDVSGKIQYFAGFIINDNVVISNEDTAKTNILSTFNLSANQTLQYGEGGYIILEDNATSGTKAETNGNHLYNIYTKNANKIFEGIDGATIPFEADETIVEGYAFGTADNTGIVIASWNEANVHGDIKAYNEVFWLDTYLNDELAVKYDKDKESVVVYAVVPFYVVYENGSLEASDGKNYTPSGKVEEDKYAPMYDIEEEKEKYFITLKKNPLTLTGAYLNGDWEDKEHNLYNYSENDIEVTDLIERDAKGRNVVVFRASWSELWYDVVLELGDGTLVDDASKTGDYTMNMKYYETKEVPVATKSGMVFVEYAYDVTLNSEDIEGFEDLYQKGDEIGPKLTTLKAGTKLYQNFVAFTGATIRYIAYYVDPNAEVLVTFDANGGNGNMAVATISYLDGSKLPNNSFTRSGYSFSGWSTKANGSVEYKNGDVLSSDNVPASAVEDGLTLYAIWKKNSSSGGSSNRSSSSGGSGGSGGSGLKSTGVIAFGINYNTNANEPKTFVEQYAVSAGTKSHNETNNNIAWTATSDGGFVANRVVVTAEGQRRVEPLRDGMYFINWNNKNCAYAFDKAGNMVTGFTLYNGKLYYLAETGTFKGAMATGEVYVDGINYEIDTDGRVKKPVNTEARGHFVYDVDAGQYRYILQGNGLTYAINTSVTVTDENGITKTYSFGIDGLMK